ncbi:hypothetical protein V6N12_061701 [Hibiscus sabdariffa]|uniref:Bet v I/Major latex protein domain-containing protein n=1 Tax=Hibiscus sabdariffa TaxID=183260 RepID=A0ABR2DZI8_9ROSI
MEVSAPFHPARAFKAIVLDFDTLFPKAFPHFVKSIEVLEGDGGPVGDIEIKEETVKGGMERQTKVFKAIEDYLVANPDA